MGLQTSSPSHRRLIIPQAVLAGTALAIAILTRGSDAWQLLPLSVIAIFSVVSELLSTRVGVDDTWLSGSFLGIVLTAVLYGGGPAAAVGLLVVLAGWPRTREPGFALRNNVITVMGLALVAGLGPEALMRLTATKVGDAGYYLIVFATFGLALGANLLGVALWTQLSHGPRAVLNAIASMLGPVLAAQLLSAVLTVTAVYVAARLHLLGLVMFGLVFAIFQYLVGELLKSRNRSHQLQRIATTDELTGLANRERFRQAVEERIVGARAAGEGFAVLLMDLDRFKEVNDTLGHAYGDRLLQDLGPRLVDAIGPHGMVARLGGDEFGILLAENASDLPTLETAVASLLETVAKPFAVEELSLEVGASVGVARFPDDGEDSGAMLRCADIGMYAAKEAQTDYKLYAAEQNQHSMRRLSVLSEIRGALSNGQIVVHYQPIVDLDDLSVSAAEGLVRWEHPEHGLIPPGAFVQTVEQSGLIGPLTRHVLENAIAQCAAWRHDGNDMSVAVNLSVRNLLDRDLPHEIERMLDVYGVPAHALQLEITESMIMSDPERALATVSRLSDLGVRLSVDDFGTGYSSLANLRRLPIDELKIDRSFVSPMLQDESDLIIVRSTINLGHDLGLKIIAEGVEDRPTLDHLAELGCDLAQGYHMAKPMAAHAFNRWLTEWPASGDAKAPPREPAPLTTLRPAAAGGWTTTSSSLLVAASEAY